MAPQTRPAAIHVDLDEDAAEWLAARIDDTQPTLDDVVRGILLSAVTGKKEELGLRPCTCGLLERYADDPDMPVIFDTVTNEFHIVKETRAGKTETVIRYCFSCGGHAPESKRARLFAIVSSAEAARLSALCASIRTFEDAVDAFGPPDADRPGGLITRTSDDGSETCSPHRTMAYDHLSDVATVILTEAPSGRVSVNFQGKYVGST